MRNDTEIMYENQKQNQNKNQNRNQNKKQNKRQNKRQNQKQRKKKRKNKNIFIIVFLICIMILLYMISGIFHKDKNFSTAGINRIVGDSSVENLVKPRKYTKEECRNKLKKLADTSAEYREIYNHIDNYPEDLLAALCSNPELLEFATGYQNKATNVTGGLTQEELKEKYPLLIQWDQRWGYATYGDSCVGLAGCAPTCMSMVILALTHNTQATPDAVAAYAQKAGYYTEGTGTSWSFMTEGASHFGIKGNQLSLSKSTVLSELQAGHPVICSMRPGDFTSQGHFIVLVGKQDGKIVVNDPNSKARSNVLWDYDVLEGQIKNLWAFKK